MKEIKEIWGGNMRIAICDDEKIYREQAEAVIEDYSKNHPEYNISCTVFEWAEDLLEAAQKNAGFDIYILDVLMPQINGIELGKELRAQGYNGKIVYLTSSEEFAIESYRVKAYNYILKPVRKDDLFSCLDELCPLIAKSTEKSIIVKTKESSLKISFDNIMFAELSRRTIVYHLIGNKEVQSVTIRTTFAQAVEELLLDKRFVMCGSGAVVNLGHITMVENEAVVFCDNYELYYSKKLCREIRSAWYDYCFSEEVLL